MSVLLDEIKIYAQDLEQRVSQLRSIADQSPEGSLCLRRSGRSVFYAVRRTENGRRTKKYLPKDNERAIRAYSRKMLSEKELPVLEKNLKAARSFIAIHSGREEEDVAECIAPEILEYCADLYVTEDRRVREWLNSKGPESPWADSQPNIKTSAGYMVRSKSEAIISNSLSAHKKVHLYEKALYLETKQYAIFPDFTIYDPKTGREIYWEHFGMMDDPDYLRAALKKISAYIQNGLIPGRDLICTFETMDHPLSSEDVECIVEALL